MPEARVSVAVRISPTAREWVATLEAETNAERAEVLRAMLAVATEHRGDVIRRINDARNAV